MKNLVIGVSAVAGIAAAGFGFFSYLQSSYEEPIFAAAVPQPESARSVQASTFTLNSESPTDNNTQASLNEISQQMQQMGSVLLQLDKRLGDLEKNQGESEGADLPEPSDAVVQEPIEAPVRTEELKDEYFASLDQRILEEGIDAGLTEQITVTLDDMVENNPVWAAGAQISETECGATICKTEMSTTPDFKRTDQFELEHEMLYLLADELPTGKLRRSYMDGGGQNLKIYFARNGHILPQVPAGDAQRQSDRKEDDS